MDKKKIIKLAKKDFEQAWIESKSLIQKPHPDYSYPKLKYDVGQSHVLYETLQNLREIYLRLGFNEVVNPVFIEESHVHKQFGKEAPAVLDRCFYLAGLPRPDIGIGIDKIEEIENLGVSLDEDKIENLKSVFRSYKKGELDGDDLVLEVANALDVTNELGLKVLERVFKELYELEPQAQKNTLRSHMTSGWFISLGEMSKNSKLPIKSFSIDRCFRREQKEDSSHLMTYHSASCVIADDEVSLDTGMATAEALLEYFGFSKFKFIPDEKKSKYYIPDTQTEVYGYHPKLKEWVEIATFGLYSPIALSKYGIDQEVMNLGCGVERIAMVLNGYNDIRKMVYPQIYNGLSLTDRQMATMIDYNYYPVTSEGVCLMNNIKSIWEDKAEVKSPCEFKIYEGDFLNHDISLNAVEKEDDTNLLGPAYSNEIFIYNGNILGIPQSFVGEDIKIISKEDNDVLEEKYKNGENDPLLFKAIDKGISTKIKFYEPLAALIAYKVEEAVLAGETDIEFRTTIARSLSDVNLKVDKIAMNYINNENKILDIRGPIFSTVNLSIK
ncbi:O-phosphoserine--tRNA ligase [Methanobrevibacter sp. DSM 116169]|uniref:O-phosphoserine--tRNA ligase n=1 Tax=Methanobrevibacter sp. DSM 116169 TaxID=3242727 RepID=UPI0038FCF92A